MSYAFRQVGVATLAATLICGSGTLALAHDHDNDDGNVYLDRVVEASGQDSCTPGFLWQGSGNPATTFQRKRNIDAGIELAIKGIVRQGPDIRSTYVDDDGLVHIDVPSGPQPSTPNRAAWNFTYSFNVGLDTSNPSLDSYDAELWIDLDPSTGIDYLRLDLSRVGSAAAAGPCPREPDTNGYGWKSHGAVIIPDDEGTDHVTQNSQNLAFYASQIDTDRYQRGIQPYTFGKGQFDVVLTIKRKWRGRNNPHHGHGDDRTTLHVVFDVVDAPTQTP